MPVTLAISPDGLTVTGGGISETFPANGANGMDGAAELTVPDAVRLSTALLRFAGEAERHDQDAPVPPSAESTPDEPDRAPQAPAPKRRSHHKAKA